MNDLVFKGNEGQALTSSLLVAEKFSKEHADVMRVVRNLTLQNCGVKNMFVEASYLNSRNQEQPMFVMNRDGFTLLAMGFTGEKALQFKLEYIEAFNQMEKAIQSGGFQLPGTFKEALLLAAQQQEQIEEQQKRIDKQAPAVHFAESVTCSNTNILIRDLAKLLCQNGHNIGEIRLYDWMVRNKYLILTKRWSKKKQKYMNDYMPTQKAAELKIFFMSETVITAGEAPFIKHSVKVTGKGQVYFINKFSNQKEIDHV